MVTTVLSDQRRQPLISVGAAQPRSAPALRDGARPGPGARIGCRTDPPRPAALVHAIGLPIAEVYGQTEDCGPTSLNPAGAIRLGTVGPPIPGVDVRIAADGEVLVRGPNVCVGYYDHPTATAELIDADGWMHSGDLGDIDDHGYLRITGRKKDLIVNAAGKNISPQSIETDLCTEPLISQVVVVGDGRPYLVALVTLDTQEVAGWADGHGKLLDPEVLATDPDVLDVVRDAVERTNATRSRVEQIKKWQVLPDDLTIARGELTPTLKVKRAAVMEHHADVIEELYASASLSERDV